MKVVVAHNRYVSSNPSGENMVVDSEIDMLRDAGVDVIPFIKSSDSLDSVGAKLKASTGPVWALATRELARIIDVEKPDVLHLHNVYPLISPWAVRTAKARGVAVVQTMHNYRHQCVAGTHLREGKVCEECTPKGLGLPAVKYGCYRGSRLQSAAMVTGRRVHRSTWQMVDRFFVLSPFMGQRLQALGVDRTRIVQRPTSAPDPGEGPPAQEKRLLFVGRLDDAKGIPMLLDAWSVSGVAGSGWSLAIAGGGPLEASVRSADAKDSAIAHLGQLANHELAKAYQESAAVVLPSIWFEGFPRVLAEAFSHGRPALASDLGSLGSLVPSGCGLLVSPERDEWVRALSWLSLGELQAWGANARRHYTTELSPKLSGERLLDTYDRVARG